MADIRDTQLRNFFLSLSDLNAEKREGQPTETYILEIETTAEFAEDPALRTRALAVLAEEQSARAIA